MAFKADHYRTKAEECRKQAERLPESLIRSQFLDIAARWSELALQAETTEHSQARLDAGGGTSK